MENLILLLFAAMLLICVFLKGPILAALLGGLALFSGYALRQGFSFRETVAMWLSGVRTAKNVLLTFCIIGFLTGLWRACGTIPSIVYYASGVIRPSLIVLLTFLLNCLLSFLIGTSFGTAATMGLICMTIAATMGIDRSLIGGAVLSGIYFGDRCSPVSTSALLTAEITGTDLYDNIKAMFKSAFVPFLLTLGLYAFLGAGSTSGEPTVHVGALFSQHFDVSWPMLVPAVSILVLAAFRVSVKKTLSTSVLLSVICCLHFQGMSFEEVIHTMIFGFSSPVPDLDAMLRGGGATSMVRTGAIVLVGSCYSGIFKRTGLLHNLQRVFEKIASALTPFAGVMGAAVISSIIACNQTLSIMMTKELCSDLVPDKKKLAISIENTAVVLSALVPWSIAGAAPLAFIEAPVSSMFFAFYLYLLPLWQLLLSFLQRRKIDI
jgi:NhaC family Na+:H+ antiporter